MITSDRLCQGVSTMTSILLKWIHILMLPYSTYFEPEKKEEILYFRLIKMMITAGWR